LETSPGDISHAQTGQQDVQVLQPAASADASNPLHGCARMSLWSYSEITLSDYMLPGYRLIVPPAAVIGPSGLTGIGATAGSQE
jgi:hypothetical protein